ncbi:mucin-22-like [Ambystoma mexicanum]|uniref:mucin-22-like n=1 Tax=Ambystoma mexicanum TaxID=8296 RepID=UPI0037E921F6
MTVTLVSTTSPVITRYDTGSSSRPMSPHLFDVTTNPVGLTDAYVTAVSQAANMADSVLTSSPEATTVPVTTTDPTQANIFEHSKSPRGATMDVRPTGGSVTLTTPPESTNRHRAPGTGMRSISRPLSTTTEHDKTASHAKSAVLAGQGEASPTPGLFATLSGGSTIADETTNDPKTGTSYTQMTGPEQVTIDRTLKVTTNPLEITTNKVGLTGAPVSTTSQAATTTRSDIATSLTATSAFVTATNPKQTAMSEQSNSLSAATMTVKSTGGPVTIETMPKSTNRHGTTFSKTTESDKTINQAASPALAGAAKSQAHTAAASLSTTNHDQTISTNSPNQEAIFETSNSPREGTTHVRSTGGSVTSTTTADSPNRHRGTGAGLENMGMPVSTTAEYDNMCHDAYPQGPRPSPATLEAGIKLSQASPTTPARGYLGAVLVSMAPGSYGESVLVP